MNLQKKIGFGILFFFLFLLGIAFFLISTTSGLNLLLRTTNLLWTPGLEIGQISGNWRNLCLRDIYYKQSGIDVNIDKAHLSFSFSCLRNGKICVTKSLLNNIRTVIDPVKLLKTEKTNKKSKLQNLSFSADLLLTYPITVNCIKLSNINIKIDRTLLFVRNITSSVSLHKNYLSINPTFLQEILIMKKKTEKKLQEKIYKRASQNFQLERNPLVRIAGTFFSKIAFLELNTINLTLNRNFQERYLQLINKDSISIPNIFLKASSTNKEVHLNALNIISNYGKINIFGDIFLQKNFPVNITINTLLNVTPIFKEKIGLKINGKIHEKLEMTANLSGPINMTLNTKAWLIEDELLLDIKAISKQISWPFNEKKIFQADDFKLKIAGSLDNFLLSFSTLINWRNFSPATVTLNADGNKQQVNLKKLTIATSNGKIETTAIFNWKQMICWRNQSKINKSGITKEVPNLLLKLRNFTSDIYKFYNGELRLNIPKLKIIGNIKENKVNVEGTLKSDEKSYLKISNLNVTFGPNNASLEGEIGRKSFDLIAFIDAPNLDNIVSGFNGQMRGSLRAQGAIKTFKLLANINASDLHWEKMSISHIHFDSNIKSDDQIKGKLKIQINHIAKSKSKIKLITLDIKGDEKIHIAKLQIQGKPISGQLYLTGTLNKNKDHWYGQINSTPLDTASGLWKLSQPITLNYYNHKQKISVGPHCWNNKNMKFCVQKTFHLGHDGYMVVNFDSFKLKFLKLFIPSFIQTNGTFHGKMNIFWNISEEGFPYGKITIAGESLKIFQMKGNPLLPIILNVFDFRFKYYGKYANLKWLVQFPDRSQLDGEVQIDDLHKFRFLTGNVNINNLNLEMPKRIIPFAKGISGKLNANLQLSGNTAVPKIYGKMKVYCVRINNSSLPLDIQPSQIVINFNGTSSKIIGEICSLQGIIKLNGEADWNQINQRTARVELKSKKIHISMLPMMRFDISPNITFEARKNLLSLHGLITVPWMRIIIRELPESSIEVSNDEIIFDKNLKLLSSKNIDIPINSNLTIHMGNDVQMEAFGIKAKLTGDIKVIQDKRGLNLNGQIKISDGRFYAYGQDLLIRKGDLLFFGSPSHPLFNIEAIRNPETTENNVIVGIHVTGSIDEPKIEIFSCPTMSQQEALSYLLRGNALNSKKSDSATMTSMLVQLGVTQSRQIISKIGKVFGVTNLTLGTQKTGDSSQIVLSGYVLPNLQIKYGMGIFDSLSTFTLRYQLLPKLYLEMIYGINQTLNLLYRFEF